MTMTTLKCFVLRHTTEKGQFEHLESTWALMLFVASVVNVLMSVVYFST